MAGGPRPPYLSPAALAGKGRKRRRTRLLRGRPGGCPWLSEGRSDPRVAGRGLMSYTLKKVPYQIVIVEVLAVGSALPDGAAEEPASVVA